MYDGEGFFAERNRKMGFETTACGKRVLSIGDGGGTVRDYIEITRGEFIKLSELMKEGYAVFSDYVKEKYVSTAILCGYGYYGSGIIEMDEIPFLYITRGRTCD